MLLSDFVLKTHVIFMHPCSALLSLYVILQPFESVITFERFIFHYLGEHFFKSLGVISKPTLYP